MGNMFMWVGGKCDQSHTHLLIWMHCGQVIWLGKISVELNEKKYLNTNIPNPYYKLLPPSASPKNLSFKLLKTPTVFP